MRNFKLLETIFGWVAFAVAAVTYCLTIEPTASFWDCGEFISSAYKLEVGHPPGNPVFMLTANLFTQFTSDPSSVAKMVNIMSALMSALTILFLFWTISRLGSKIILESREKVSLAQGILLLGSAMVGSLAYTFSDTFWFSAVEGEVYAYSSLFTAVVFWLILKWEDHADQSHGDRWLIFIAYMMGLSIGVHLLNLLAIPAIVLVYYYKKNPQANLKGSLIALMVSFIIVGLVMWGLIPGVVKVAGWFELLFVNTLSLPFNTGLIIYLILLAGSLIWGIVESGTGKNTLRIKLSILLPVVLMGIPFIAGNIIGFLLIIALAVGLYYAKNINIRLTNSIIASMMVIMLGYFSYALIPIRSAANTPMDQNSPEDIFALGSYLNREQYGDRPLLYGQCYSAEVKRDANGSPVVEEGAPVYVKKVKSSEDEKDAYIIIDHKNKYLYDDPFMMLFPRMYSSTPDHIKAYQQWGEITGTPVTVYSGGQPKTVTRPTFIENMRFFVSYQLNFMYWRYFMWNFSGRQNDIQGSGEIQNGNWISGINFIDKFIVGDQEKLPQHWAANKGHNKYYMLPLLLGIIGLIYQAYSGQKGIQSFWVTFFLFFMTGIAIVIYLNQTPFQPRERDYAYAGSFYAFCIWIGLGVAGLASLLQKGIKNQTACALIASVACLAIPIQMASQNWDDHDRSDRYTCRDFGANYLHSCAPNAIIFTNGDNDTFPLWYNQEVEGVRTDVRVCNLSYLQTDWYIDQMKRQAYESDPLPISWTPQEYQQGAHDFAYVINATNNYPLSVQEAMTWVKSNDSRFKKVPGYSEELDYIPTENLYIPVDKEKVKEQQIVPIRYRDDIPDTMKISLSGKRYLGKQELMILDMLAHNNWERPIYYAVTVGADQYLGMKDNFSLEGLSYRITPNKVSAGMINTDVMFDNMLHKFKWGGIDNPKVYLDENNLRMCRTFRHMFSRLIEALIEEGKNDSAKVALDYALKVIPSTTVPHDYTSLSLAESYYQLGVSENARQILESMATMSLEELKWYSELKPAQMAYVASELQYNLAILYNIMEVYGMNDPSMKEKYEAPFNQYRMVWETLQSKVAQR